MIMRHSVVEFAVIFFALLSFSDPLRAQEGPYADASFQGISVSFEGADYQLEYRRYPEPYAVDLSGLAGDRGTPFGVARGFWRALAAGQNYDAVAAHTLTVAGQPGLRPVDEVGHMAAARDILGGGVRLYGEIAYGDYRIFVYRYPNSISRDLGLPVRRFGDRYFVVTDLVESDPLARRMSALRWDIDRLAAEHPTR